MFRTAIGCWIDISERPGGSHCTGAEQSADRNEQIYCLGLPRSINTYGANRFGQGKRGLDVSSVEKCRFVDDVLFLNNWNADWRFHYLFAFLLFLDRSFPSAGLANF